MSDVVVRAAGVAKQFRIGEHTGGSELLSERLARGLRRSGSTKSDREFWALQDIDFEVRQGESFGIIGHNGAGKSTLLKILSRVTPPTRGEIDLYGRVGALLEVGTGFHAELTGAENIYLNGAILGLRRAEVAKRFDEIVEFAEVERFINTPVKRYSSGMYLRLAFAVAAHHEPEILIIDEVLSVGDLAFQEKCLGRMQDVSSEGRTVLFVSHNLAAVNQLCERSMLLDHGEKVTEGPTTRVIEEYVKRLRTRTSVDLAQRTDRVGNGRLRFTSLALESGGRTIDTPATGQDVDIVLGYETADGQPLRNVNVALTVLTPLGELMLHLYTITRGELLRSLPAAGTVRCSLPRLPLPAGQYLFNVWSDIGGEILDWVQSAVEITVIDGDFYGAGQTPQQSHRTVLVDHDWSVDSVPASV
jgi:lipopolysaccharide transport system ATP-binding protein